MSRILSVVQEPLLFLLKDGMKVNLFDPKNKPQAVDGQGVKNLILAAPKNLGQQLLSKNILG